jgi:hypothetical protein
MHGCFCHEYFKISVSLTEGHANDSIWRTKCDSLFSLVSVHVCACECARACVCVCVAHLKLLNQYAVFHLLWFPQWKANNTLKIFSSVFSVQLHFISDKYPYTLSNFFNVNSQRSNIN